jgi:pimeloyl-ACP methyl ester carboxylesterase
MHVVLVSGWMKADFLWSRYRKWFEREGFTTSVLNTGYFNLGPIQASAKQLARHINELKHPPILVGHSMGGLIIRHYMARYYPSTQTDVAGVITVGSPLNGSPLARFAPWSSSACQMVPDSPFMRKFDSYSDPEIPWLSIKCNYDLIVPGDYAVLEDGEACSLSVNATHTSALLQKSVWQEVMTFAMDCLDLELLFQEAEEEDIDEE